MLDDAVVRVRWRLRHVQTGRALDLIGNLLARPRRQPESRREPAGPEVATLLRALETYIAGQADLIIDYAAARHRGEPISTATTESTVQRLLHRRKGAKLADALVSTRRPSDADGAHRREERHLRFGAHRR